MKNYVLIPITAVSAVLSWFIWQNTPEYIHQGGPLLVVGLTFLFLTFGMLVLSGRGRGNTLFIVLLSAGLAVGGYLLFVVAFERHFPEGPFEHAFKAMLHAMGGG